MRLLRLRIANFRGVKEAEARFAEQGVTLVQGANETGKTSLMDAIAILFKFKDNSAHEDVRDLRPVGEDVGTEVELEGICGGKRFAYRKVFNKNRMTELRVFDPGEAGFAGTPAHEEAKRMLDESLDRTLWDALSVAQGKGADLPGMAGCKPLMDALDRAAGGGGGYDHASESLHALIRAEYLRYFTPTGKDGRDLTRLAGTLDESKTRERELAEAAAVVEDQANRAEALKKSLIDLRRSRQSLAGQLARRGVELERVERLEREVASAGHELKAAEGRLILAEREVRDRTGLADDEKNLLERIAALAKALEPVAAGVDESLARLETAGQAYARAGGERERKEALYRLRQKDFEYFDDSLHLDSMRRRKSRLDASLDLVRAARRELAGNAMTEAMIDDIARAEQETAALGDLLEQSNPHVTIRGLEDGRVRVNDEDRIAGAESPLSCSVRDRLTIIVPERVAIEISAGTAAAEAAGRLASAEAALRSLLAAGNVRNLKEAYAALDRREKAGAALAGHDAIAAECLGDLAYEELADRIARLEETLPGHLKNRGDAPAMASGFDDAKRLRNEAEKDFHDADRAFAGARNALEAAKDGHEDFRRSHIERSAEMAALSQRLDHVRDRLASARSEFSDESLAEARAGWRNEAAHKEEALRKGTEALAGLDPENVRLMHNTLSESLRGNELREKETEKELAVLESALETKGESGLFEELQAARLRSEALELEAMALRRRANATRFLCEVFSRRRDETRKRYVLPLKTEVERLGRMVFGPSLRVTIDEADLSVADRTLNGRTVGFGQLSGGAKEQLALLYRAACSTMAGAGSPPVILDDALGHSDPERLLSIGAVLAKLGRETQVIVFTCVPDRYKNIGDARIVDLM